jgi:hypothetical protein
MNTLQIGCVAGLLLLEDVERNEKTSRKKQWWTHPTLSHRLSIGNFHTSFNNHRIYTEKLFQYYRMSVTSYIAPPISAQHVAFTSLFEYSLHCKLYKDGQINFSTSNIVHKCHARTAE